MIKVIFFLPSVGGGGAEMHLVRLVNRLNRSLFAPSVVAVRPGGSFEAMLASDVPVHHLQSAKSLSSTLSLLKAIRLLRKHLEKDPPDLLFSIMDHANIAASLAIRKLNSPPKLVLGVQTSPYYAWKINRKVVQRIINLLIPRIYPKADLIVALSEGVRQELIGMQARLQSKTITIYNIGLEEDRSSSNPDLDIGKIEKTIILSLGRLLLLKGYQYLIPAMAKIRKKHNAELWILGEGPYRPQLEKLIQEHRLESSVHLKGFQTDVEKFYRKADIYVLSSLYEGFGNVIVEAMAHDLPVVATDCPYGPGEIITDGVSGVLVRPADTESLANGIMSLLDDPASRSKIVSQASRQLNRFTADTIANQYEAAFTKICRK